MISWQNIASTLGKDRYQDLYWSAEIPSVWSIKPTQDTTWCNEKNLPHYRYSNDAGIEFRFNNLGWRSDFDYDQDLLTHKNVIVLGCSDTFGPALKVEQTWPMILQDLLGDSHRVLNLSWGGISTDWIARIGHKTLRYLGNSCVAVCVLWPHLSSREFVSKRISSGISTHLRSIVPYPQWWNFIDWKSNNYNFHKNRHLLTSISKNLAVNFFDLTINRKDPGIPWDIISYDGYQSLGHQSHLAISDFFFREIQGRPSYWQETRSRSL
jgi:hypothetical protein